jgi:hypothetical protein
MVRDATWIHFDEHQRPSIIKLDREVIHI